MGKKGCCSMSSEMERIFNAKDSQQAASTEQEPKLGLVCTPLDDTNLALACQISCTDIVYYDMGGAPTLPQLQAACKRAESAGLSLSVVEGGPTMDAIVAGGPDREVQLEGFIQLLSDMGACGVRVLCYNFMHWGCRVGRTSYEVPIRGGALSSRFDIAEWDDTVVSGEIPTREQMWSNLDYFLRRVMPAAEQHGVMLAMHPDDPPLSSIRGLPRIMNTVEDFDKLLALHSSPNNGVCFDVSLFGLMNLKCDGPGTPALIRKMGSRIHFVHFRDVVGTPTAHVEVFHDQAGLSDHVEVMRALRSAKFVGVIRPDHVPLLAGEAGHATGNKAAGYFSGKASGYTMLGRLFAIGYLRGLLKAEFHPSNLRGLIQSFDAELPSRL